uniref:Uncharacterized protein n=1 Tax=Saimiri boliviensis boliviensis TaxID=39432 RepID=A0A2K6UJC3_SAIBB
MRNSVVCPTRLLWRLSPSRGLATCKNLESGAGEVVRASDSLWLRTTGRTRILREDRAVQRHHRRSPGNWAPQVSGAPRRGRAGTRRASAPSAVLRAKPVLGGSAATCSAAGRVLPVDLERERAALCARQSGHDPPEAWWLLGSRSAESGGPGRCRVAAELARPGASLICQSELRGSGGRGGRGPSAEMASGYSGRRRALPGAADLRQKGARTGNQLPEAAKPTGNVGKWGEPHKFSEVGNQ